MFPAPISQVSGPDDRAENLSPEEKRGEEKKEDRDGPKLTPAEGNEKSTSIAHMLTEEETYDNKVWSVRFLNEEVFKKRYVPTRWEGKEMDSIIKFLALKNPTDDSEYLVCSIDRCFVSYIFCEFHPDSKYQSLATTLQNISLTKNKEEEQRTREAIASIFFPKPQECKSVLLKRGPVLLGGEERELMLFTHGFVVSRFEIDSLLSVLLDEGLTGSANQSMSGRFRSLDVDASGCKYHLQCPRIRCFVSILNR